MRIKHLLLSFTLLANNNQSFSQVTYLPLSSEDGYTINRITTKMNQLPTNFSLSQQPISRKDAVNFLLQSEKMDAPIFSTVDKYNIYQIITENGEWAYDSEGMNRFQMSKKKIFNFFYPTKTDFIQAHTDDLYLSVNPVLYVHGFKQSDDVENIRSINFRGVEARGRIADKIGFYTLLGDNQEKPLSYVNEYADYYGGFPGNDFAVRSGQNNDIFVGRGYFDVALWKNYVNLTFGYDKNFVGYGYRSLVLSDFTAPNTFLRLRANWKKWNYEHLMQQYITDEYVESDNIKHKKYASIQQLNYKPNNWLTVGLFEHSVFHNKDGMNGNIFVPVLAYNSIRSAIVDNNNDNSMIGAQFQLFALNTFRIYGQGFINGYANNSVNKDFKIATGWQLGINYYDVANVDNLDLLVEYNRVSPYAYAAAKDSVSNFSTQKLALAHPLGNNFDELIGKIKYQPFNKWTIDITGIYSRKSFDKVYNQGNNIFTPKNVNNGPTDVEFLNGTLRKSMYLSGTLAYQLIPNLYLEGSLTYLKRTNDGVNVGNDIKAISGGIRWNIARRNYDFN